MSSTLNPTPGYPLTSLAPSSHAMCPLSSLAALRTSSSALLLLFTGISLDFPLSTQGSCSLQKLYSASTCNCFYTGLIVGLDRTAQTSVSSLQLSSWNKAGSMVPAMETCQEQILGGAFLLGRQHCRGMSQRCTFSLTWKGAAAFHEWWGQNSSSWLPSRNSTFCSLLPSLGHCGSDLRCVIGALNHLGFMMLLWFPNDHFCLPGW